MNIALIGFGGVGQAFTRLVEAKKETLSKQGLQIRLLYICNSRTALHSAMGIDLSALHSHLDSGGDLSSFRNSHDEAGTVDAVFSDSAVDMVIELTPTNKKTGQPGLNHIQRALEAGQHVVTGNKGPVLVAYRDLQVKAEAAGVHFMVGCTAGGALPSVSTGSVGLAGAEILSLEGVLNGTTNFILDEMESAGCSYDTALEKAQRLGIAETDPTLDVEGWDTAAKLLILTNILCDQSMTLADVEVKGITRLTADEISLAAEGKSRWKLVGRAVRDGDGYALSVTPELLDAAHPLYPIGGKNKGLLFKTDSLGDIAVSGGASGTTPAAASILRDILAVHTAARR